MARPKGSQRGVVRRSAGRTAGTGCLMALFMLPFTTLLGLLRGKR